MSFALADSESVLIICGPTAIGKTGVAMAVQDALGGSHRAQLISGFGLDLSGYGHRHGEAVH